MSILTCHPVEHVSTGSSMSSIASVGAMRMIERLRFTNLRLFWIPDSSAFLPRFRDDGKSTT